MTVVPNQFFGIGDIIFCQTLVRRIANGNPIVWPVLPQFVDGLNRAYPDIAFVDHNKFHINYESKEQCVTNVPNYGECTILPLRWADAILKLPYTDCMKAKYKLYGMDWQDWKESAMWQRDSIVNEVWKESILMTDLGIGLGHMGAYKLINRFFRSDMSGAAQIKEQGIEMCNMAGYSLFDWAHVIEQAGEIHTVSTSIIYMLEMLDIKAPIHLYVRKPDEVDFRNVDYILQKHNYIKHV